MNLFAITALLAAVTSTYAADPVADLKKPQALVVLSDEDMAEGYDEELAEDQQDRQDLTQVGEDVDSLFGDDVDEDAEILPAKKLLDDQRLTH